jgi:AraC family transcriptional regulator
MTKRPAHLATLERALSFIEDRFEHDTPPSVSDVAKASGVSQFHFHRIFKALTGETCAELIARLRLARGMALMRDGRTSVTQAAMAAGYASSQAFAKAMKRELSETSTTLRSDPERLGSVLATLSVPSGEGSERPLEVHLADLEPLSVVLVRTENAYPELNDTYNSIYETQGGPDNILAAIGVPHRDIETFAEPGFVFDAGVVLKAAESSTQPLSLGHCLVFRHVGPDERLGASLDVLFGAALGAEGLDIRDEPPLFHYIDDPEETDEADCRVDLYLPVTPRTA